MSGSSVGGFSSFFASFAITITFYVTRFTISIPVPVPFTVTIPFSITIIVITAVKQNKCVF